MIRYFNGAPQKLLHGFLRCLVLECRSHLDQRAAKPRWSRGQQLDGPCKCFPQHCSQAVQRHLGGRSCEPGAEGLLRQGPNIISILTPASAPAVTLQMAIQKSDGSWLPVATDHTWHDGEDQSVEVLGDYAQSSFANIGILEKSVVLPQHVPCPEPRAVRRATLYIYGLGHFMAYLNGERIGENVIDPG